MATIPERYNASVLLDSNLDAGRSDKVAIYCGDEKITYGQLFDRVCRMGRALLELGVRREERVLLVLGDTRMRAGVDLCPVPSDNWRT